MYRTASFHRTKAGALPMALRALTVAFLLAFALLIAGCQGTEQAAAPTPGEETPVPAGPFPITITDDADRTVTIESEPQRIVSIAPSNTEIVAALGLLDRLVGVTSFDDYPPEVSEIAVVGDFVGPNLEAVAAADPDVVLATAGVQADVVTQLEELGAIVIVVDPTSLDELFNSIEMVGSALGVPDVADGVVSEMLGDLSVITQAIGDAEPVACFLEIAQNPLFTAGSGTLLDNLIVAAGGRNVVTQEGFVGYSIEQIVTDDPAVYFATSGSMSDPADLAARPGFSGLTAVETGRVYVLEDNLISRPGPRVVEGVRQMAEALHPDAF